MAAECRCIRLGIEVTSGMIDFNEKQRRVLRAQEQVKGLSCPPRSCNPGRGVGGQQSLREASVRPSDGGDALVAPSWGRTPTKRSSQRSRASAPRNRQGPSLRSLRIWPGSVSRPRTRRRRRSFGVERSRRSICERYGTQDLPSSQPGGRLCPDGEKMPLPRRSPTCPAPPEGIEDAEAYVKGYGGTGRAGRAPNQAPSTSSFGRRRWEREHRGVGPKS